MLMVATTFQGFSRELPVFLAQLRDNNSREWFQAHRAHYEAVLLEPAREFVLAMAEPLRARLGPDLHADPKVHGSILAINRDTRFSPDKTPYKTHLDLWFWHGGGSGPNRERPGYFFRLTPESLILGAGMHLLPDSALDRFRRAVLDDTLGARLDQLAQRLEAAGPMQKRVPAGLPQEHPRADWLRRTGLYAETTQSIPQEFYTPEFPEFCLKTFARFAPLLQWLVEVLPA